MGQRPGRDIAWGILVGVVVALGFALVIGFIPEQAFTDEGWRVVLYIVQVPSGLVIALALRVLAGVLSVQPHRFVVSAAAGALALDGVALGFFPGIYGQPEQSAVWVASTLLWAFAWIIAAELFIEARGRQDDPATAVV